MTAVRPSPLLSRALALDAAASGALAALQLVASPGLAGRLALPQPLLFESGLFLLVYVGLLAFMSLRPALPAALVALVIAGNFGWSLACIALGALLQPSALGLAYLWLQAGAVLLFAGLQWAGLRASSTADRPARATAPAGR